VSVYGAIATTVTAVWNICWNGLRDRGRLRLELRLLRSVQDEATYEWIERPMSSLEGAELHLTAVNVGRRPIAVDAWCGVLRRRAGAAGIIRFGEATPRKRLDETEECVIVSRDFIGAFTSGLRRMYVTDSSGRRWSVPRKCLRATARHIAALRSCDRPV
jgi:hypothetical protein